MKSNLLTLHRKIGWPLFLAFVLTSCDAPRSTRVGSPPNSGFYIKKGQVGMGGIRSANVPAEVAHCRFSADGKTGYQDSRHYLKEYTLCQSSLNELDIYIQLKIPTTDAQLCLIPSNHNGKESTYIGSPRCFSIEDGLTIYKVTIPKDRPGFDKFKLNGILITKNELNFYPLPFGKHLLNTDAFLSCSEILAQTGDKSYCESFISLGEYVYHRF